MTLCNNNSPCLRQGVLLVYFTCPQKRVLSYNLSIGAIICTLFYYFFIKKILHCSNWFCSFVLMCVHLHMPVHTHACMHTSNWLLAVNWWLLAGGSYLLADCCLLLLAPGCWLLAAVSCTCAHIFSCWLLAAAGCSWLLLAAPLVAASCWLVAASCLLLAACCCWLLLPTGCC